MIQSEALVVLVIQESKACKKGTMIYKRPDLEKREYEILDVRATKAIDSKGRIAFEKKCEYRTDFQRDRDRIIHSKAFRRLVHKTQVFISPEGDHYRTRLTHTLEVAQISRTISRILNYNEDLTEAIALGHDLGHTPFGHSGEFILNEIHPGGFHHNEQSLRVVDRLEKKKDRFGLNLTWEVRDGILNHRSRTAPKTLEGQIVRISDKIAYVNHDIDDALRSGVISQEDLPIEDLEVLGFSHGDRINNLIEDLVINSENKDSISLSDRFNTALMHLRAYMFKNVYSNEKVKKEEDLVRVREQIIGLYEYFLNNPEKMPDMYQTILEEDGLNTAVKDYVAGMTDRYANKLYNSLIV